MSGQVISKVVMDAETVTTISNNINSMYSIAISQLTSYTIAVIGVVGILIPIIVTLIQWRSLKTEKENLEKHINDEISKAKINIRDEFNSQLKEFIASEETKLFSRVETKFHELEKKIACADASSFHIQGNGQLAKKYYGSAAEDLISATELYLNGDDELNGQRTLRLLIEKCLPEINKDDYERLDLDDKFASLIEHLRKINNNNRHFDSITKLVREMKSAKVRQPAKENVGEKK